MLITISFVFVGDLTLKHDFSADALLPRTLVPCCHCLFFGGWSKFGHDLDETAKIGKIKKMRWKIKVAIIQIKARQ